MDDLLNIIAARHRGFDPSKVSSAGLVFWLEAGDDCEKSAGVPAGDGELIEFWRDKSSNGNDFTAFAPTQKPKFTASGASEGYVGPVVTSTSALTPRL